MARTDPQINIRMPAELLNEIAGQATENRRSTSAEIVARLEGGGKTLRDELAMAAITGMLAHGRGPTCDWYDHPPSAATWAYGIADAMLAERQKGGA